MEENGPVEEAGSRGNMTRSLAVPSLVVVFVYLVAR